MAEKVAIGFVHDTQDLSWSWHTSYTSLIGWILANPDVIDFRGEINMKYGTDGLPGARNTVVAEFLKGDADWLWWIDCDMGFAPDTISHLLDAADPTERPVVGGLCFMLKQYAADGMGGYRAEPRPTIFDIVQAGDAKGLMARASYPKDALVRCYGTGSACILIHRSVFEQVAERLQPGEGWYDKIAFGGDVQPEDLAFCLRLAVAGIPLYVHTGVKTTHKKTVWIAEHDFLTSTWPRPATDPVAVIVPAMRRPHNVAPFMQSLRASTGLATAYFICDEDDHDQIKAVEAEDATVVINDGTYRNFATKANVGYRATSEPWMLLVGDDVIFRPGWYDRALRAAEDRFHMVATNDLGNSAVLAGVHATHPLIRRSWIDESGASWDGPGTVAHEGYRHGWVDNEWTAKAMQEGVFTYAPDSVIEHLHPEFGKANMDEVYRRGFDVRARDGQLFNRRYRQYAKAA